MIESSFQILSTLFHVLVTCPYQVINKHVVWIKSKRGSVEELNKEVDRRKPLPSDEEPFFNSDANSELSQVLTYYTLYTSIYLCLSAISWVTVFYVYTFYRRPPLVSGLEHPHRGEWAWRGQMVVTGIGRSNELIPSTERDGVEGEIETSHALPPLQLDPHTLPGLH